MDRAAEVMPNKHMMYRLFSVSLKIVKAEQDGRGAVNVCVYELVNSFHLSAHSA